MSKVDERLSALRDSGHGDTAEMIVSCMRSREPILVATGAALEAAASGRDPDRAAVEAVTEWEAEPPTPGDLSGSFDREHSDASRKMARWLRA